MCVDRENPLREGAFFFTRMALFPSLDKRSIRNKTKGLRTSSERHIGVSWVCDALHPKLEGRTLSNSLIWMLYLSKVSLDMNRQFHKSPLSRDLPSYDTLPLPSP